MRLRLCLAAGALEVIASTGCPVQQDISLKPESLVGEYAYHSASWDSAPPQNRLILRADGTYTLTEDPATKYGQWRLVGGAKADIVLGDAVYPVKVNRKEVRILINDDRGQWYTKIK